MRVDKEGRQFSKNKSVFSVKEKIIKSQFRRYELEIYFDVLFFVFPSNVEGLK